MTVSFLNIIGAMHGIISSTSSAVILKKCLNCAGSLIWRYLTNAALAQRVEHLEIQSRTQTVLFLFLSHFLFIKSTKGVAEANYAPILWPEH
jgi:hypothetical protein